MIGAEHLCMGADYNGVGNVPNGMEDVSRYPYLIAELLKRGWTQDEVQGQLMHNSESKFMMNLTANFLFRSITRKCSSNLGSSRRNC